MGSEAGTIDAVERPATVGSLTAELSGAGLAGEITIVHSSLSSLGWVAGGAQAVVEALLAAAGPSATLVMPTQTGQLSDPAAWGDPPVPAEWIHAIRDGLPTYDSDLTPTRSMGAIVECFRSHPETVRSAHPLVSFAANGPLARRIVEPHALTPAFGEPSPLGRLYDLDAQVLLLGVDHGINTSLHLAEHRADWTDKASVQTGAPMIVDGKRQWVTESDLDVDESDFIAIGDAFAASGGERSFAVANATARRCRVRAIVDYSASWMSRHRPGSLHD